MNRRKLAKNKVIHFLASYKLTMACLMWLFVLVLWGTVHQVDQGLYSAQQKIFYAWFAKWGVLPLPGARIIIWILGVNLLFAALFKFQYKWSKFGVHLTHFGLCILLYSSWVTYHYAQESNLTLEEGKGSNVSQDYHLWELSVWSQEFVEDTLLKNVEAYELQELAQKEEIIFNKHSLKVKFYGVYENCNGILGGALPQGNQLKLLNVSGIKSLKPLRSESDPVQNIPGVEFDVSSLKGQKETNRLILYGGESEATPVLIGGKIYYFALNHRRHVLPVTVSLLDFMKEEYPGTQKAKSYASRVVITENNMPRELVISMNKPLRVGNYTFYQASFSQSADGEASTFSIVEHPGRMLPYISTIIVALGMLIHFLQMLFKYAIRKQAKR